MNTIHRKFPYAFTWLLLIFIAAVTLMHAPEVDDDMPMIPHIDKVIHFALFGLVSATWWWEYMLRRGCPTPRWCYLWPIAICTSLIGGLDELLQGLLTADRSADLADWIADTVGAFALPAALSGVVARLLPDNEVCLSTIKKASEIPAHLEQIYVESFPESERRPWEQITQMSTREDSPLRFTIINHNDVAAGFITWWQFKRFVYVEHFVVDPQLRGHGIGSAALRLFLASTPNGVVLEVEPSGSTPMADSRIAFYQRCGFIAHPEYRYIQPPYGEHLPSVELMLMTTPKCNAPLRDIDHTLKVMVYKAQPTEYEIP